jgi:hypothetical protein
MKKENNKKIGLVAGGIIILFVTFYAGVTYGKSKIPARGAAGIQAFQNNGGIRSGRNGGGFIAGEVISKDDKSITIQLVGGGSKIIFLDANTKISKMVVSSSTDIAIGTQVSITGTVNADGSENAQAVQIRTNAPQSVVQ